VQTTQTVVPSDAWIRQPKQPLGTLKSLIKLPSRVTDGLDSTISPLGLKNHQRTTVTGDAWIRQPKQPIGTHKT